MTDHEKNYDLTLEEVVPRLREIVEEMRGATDRAELKDISADTAYELGYETAVHDIARLTGPDPVESGIIIMHKSTGETDDER